MLPAGFSLEFFIPREHDIVIFKHLNSLLRDGLDTVALTSVYQGQVMRNIQHANPA